eukprot:gene7188-6791_t
MSSTRHELDDWRTPKRDPSMPDSLSPPGASTASKRARPPPP